jgi:hypothetical protein
MSTDLVAIFPASGGIGGSTYQHLVNLVDAKNIILIARNPAKIPKQYTEAGAIARLGDYDKLETLDHAFDGAKYLNLISYASIEHEHRFKVSKQRLAKGSCTLLSLLCRSTSMPLMQPSNRVSNIFSTPPLASQAVILIPLRL